MTETILYDPHGMPAAMSLEYMARLNLLERCAFLAHNFQRSCVLVREYEFLPRGRGSWVEMRRDRAHRLGAIFRASVSIDGGIARIVEWERL